MSLLSTASRKSIRAAIRRAATDTATIERTNVQSPCIVIDSNQNVRLERGHVLMVLRRWDIMMPDLQTDGTALDVVAGDILHVGSRLYLVSVINQPETYEVAITAECILLGTAVTASTKRPGGALRVGQTAPTGNLYPHLTNLTAYRIYDTLVTLVAPEVAMDVLGVGDQQLGMVVVKRPVLANFADPAKVNEDFPIAADDTLVLPQGSYVVKYTEPFAVNLIAIYVADPVRH
jgi:hypothetical protein